MAPLDLVPYQIDYSSKNVGKTVANTKKAVEFKFGFANNDAVAHGQKGVECRGVEHKVVLKWSLTSGKTVVECDMKEIHFGLSGNKFQFSWPLRKNVVVEMIGHAAPCSTKGNAPANWKQFDMFINGMSYFHFPKIFELGIVPFRGLQAHPSPYGRNSPRGMMGMGGGQGYGGGNFGRSSYNAPPPGDFAAAPYATPRDQTPPSPPKEADLLDFGAPEPVPAPIQQEPQFQPQQAQQMYGAAPAPEFAIAPAASPAAQVPPVAAVPPAYELQQPTFAATPAPPVFPAPAPHYAEPAVPAFAAAPVAPPAPRFDAPQAPPVEAPVRALPPAQTNEGRDPGTLSGVERALDNLVNLSDITLQPLGKLTMMSSDDKKNSTKPAFNNVVPLLELKSTVEPKKSVMNTFTPNPASQQPGMYGAQQYGMPQQQAPQPGMYGQSPIGMGGYQQQQPPMAPQQTPYSNYQL
eukprot:CAMPEP_0181029800 /NCGR_PEP_ID=MMETSP1070-20121207/5390_1 /TAXON_ID=265543 /ORGANISM="Minutocellus polymorphus, Strain NH13" /LENGTH=462 /DNA_ID=CAMNT_0023107131 /DNA_START=56 /DNA_END=1444 /DNA_ORIENTATION=+